MERKFTDDAIVKALECCFIHSNCTNCPLQSPPTEGCLRVACTQALDLIKRKKEEIDRLQSKVEKLGKEQYDLCGQIVNLEDDVKYSKYEAIKEFAERLKKEIRDACFAYEADSQCEYIDNLVKEMTKGGV